DITVQFSCSARYIGNMPLNYGSSTTIRLRLGPDCGSLVNSLPAEMPMIGGTSQLVTGGRLQSVVPGEVELQLTWARDLDFVMAPTTGGLGLRVRLIGVNRRKAAVYAAPV